MTSEAVKGGTRLGETGPPLKYPLHDVSIVAFRQPGNPAFDRHTVEISGNGSCSHAVGKPEGGNQLACPSLSRVELKELLNRFYRISFFDSKDSYLSQYTVVLQEDGTVVTQALRLVDMETKTVCFKVADYEKCVTMDKNAPNDLITLADRILGIPQKKT